MLKADSAKTKLALNKRWILGSLLIIVAVFALLAPSLFYQPSTAKLAVGNREISLEIASSDAARQKGLGGRDTLSKDKGMLFVFAQPAKQCFWMKDMRFSLDMVFLDAQKRVVSIYPDISPRTYPNNFCADNAQYVIEMTAGQAAALGLRAGQSLSF
ncbi:MAG: DUF192 domain-containing protein [Candidatus Saccharimonadales bacterium]